MGTVSLSARQGIMSTWMIGSLVLALVMLYGITMTLIYGEAVHGTTAEVPWGILIASYVFFSLSSTGLCVVSSMGHVFGIEKFQVIAKRSMALAIILLLCGFIQIGMELGHPFRMFWVVLSPNFSSAIWWMGALYSFYLVFIVVEFICLLNRQYRIAAYMGFGGFVFGIAAYSNLGSVFGYMDSRPFWTGPYLPIYFILSALVSGAALVIIIMTYGYRGNFTEKARTAMHSMSKLLCIFVGIHLFFTFWKVFTGLYSNIPGKVEAVELLLFGPFAFKFWFFEVLLGMLIPFVVILATRANNLKASLWAAISVIIGSFFIRYILVIVGQVVTDGKEIPGYPEFVRDIVSYTPTLVELSIVFGGVGLAFFLYMLAERVFQLDADEH